MKKGGLVSVGIVVIIFIGALTLGVKRTRTVDWEESFNEKSTKPYGLSVLYKELHTLFKDDTIQTVYHQPASYLSANATLAKGKGNYIIIGRSMYLSDASIRALLDFTSKGNHLFISNYHFPLLLKDTLGLEVSYAFNPKKDSISRLGFTHRKQLPILIDKNAGDYYFSNLPAHSYEPLGYAETDSVRVNFIRIPFGEGQLLLHTEPKAFTNYNILKAKKYTYTEHVLSFLPNAHQLYFDSFYKYQTTYDDVEEDPNLSWFLEQPAFRWAWYTSLVFLLLFMIFNAKRRQRIIKIITPLRNTSLAFVKTISNLYIEAKDYNNIIDKKITYFLERVRTDFNVDTSVLDTNFIENLALKAGKSQKDVETLITYITQLRAENTCNETQLITLNTYIDAFYFN